MHRLICPSCGNEMVLRRSRFGPFYSCLGYPYCRSKVGAHADGRPLGFPGDDETRSARKRAHQVFDQLCRRCGWTRFIAYRWLADQMDLAEADCHFGMFTAAQCFQAIALVENARRSSIRKAANLSAGHVGRRKGRRRPRQTDREGITRRPRDLNEAREQEES